jgi:hypothetical protein
MISLFTSSTTGELKPCLKVAIVFLDSDAVLMDIPLPYREIPIFRISAGEFMGTPYGYSPMFDVFPFRKVLIPSIAQS